MGTEVSCSKQCNEGSCCSREDWAVTARVCGCGSGLTPVAACSSTAAVSVHFSQALYYVNETAGPAALELVLEGTAAIPVMVTVGTLQLLDSSVGMEATGRLTEWEECQ